MNAPRSAFVTVVGGIFAAFSGLSCLVFLMQTILFHNLLNRPEMQEALRKPPAGMPDAIAFIFAHFGLFIGFMLVANLCILGVSIGLLLRKNWARLGFIAALFLLIGWNLFGIVLQMTMFSSMSDHLPPSSDVHTFKMVMVVMSVVCAVFSLAFCTLFAWIIKKLISAEIVAEFQPAVARL